MRGLASLISACLSVLLLFCLSVVVLGLSPTGLQLFMHLLPNLMPGRLTIARTQGELANAFIINNIVYRYDNSTLQIKQLNVRWQPQDLFNKTITIQSIKLAKVKITYAPIQLNINPLRFSGKYFLDTHHWQTEWQGQWQCIVPQQLKGRGTIHGSNTLLPSIDGQLTIFPLQITLKNLHLQFNAQKEFQGSANSGGGHLQWQGDLSHLRVTGTQFLVSNTYAYQVWVSPNLYLVKQGDQLQLTGKLFVPRANIHPPDFREKAVTLPKDVKIIDKKNTSSSDELIEKLYANIHLGLGNAIHVQIEGLTGDIAGNIALHNTPSRPATGNGELIIHHGQYAAYGKRLQISDGRLIFNGNAVTNPNVQIRATRQITIATPSNAQLAPISNLPSTGNQGSMPVAIGPAINQTTQTTVGVNVTGTVENPQFNLFSTPIALSQADILSYLLLGHPADQLSPTDASLLVNLASGMHTNTNQFEQLTREIKSIFSLDELNIQSTSYVDPTKSALQQNTSLVLAKALSPRLYVSYSVGLLEPVNILSIKYLLSERWSLQSTNSTLANGADLIYTFEK